MDGAYSQITMIEEFTDEELVDELIKRHDAKEKAMLIVREPDDNEVLMRHRWTGCQYTIMGMAGRMTEHMNEIIRGCEGEPEPRV